MSEKLTQYVRTAFVGSLDMALGTLVATIVSSFFGEPGASDSWIKLLTEAWLQGMMTLLIGGELRSTTFPENYDDPTGGTMFMACVMNQPTFWARIKILQTMFTDWIFGKASAKPLEDTLE